MHAPGDLHRRHPTPFFANHTPRHLEIIGMRSPSQYTSEMFGPSCMAIDAGSSHSHVSMGQAASAEQRRHHEEEQHHHHYIHQDSTGSVHAGNSFSSSNILRQQSIKFEESSIDPVSPSPDSWSMHCACTNQAPYLSSPPTAQADNMMTQTSILQLPKGNPSHDLAFFLRTTGPTASHRKPSKLENQKRSTPRNALRFFKVGHKRLVAQIEDVQRTHQRCEAHSASSDTTDNQRLNEVLYDEGGLLADEPPLPKNVQQKVSSTGKRYLAFKEPEAQKETPKLHPGAEKKSDSSFDYVDEKTSMNPSDDIPSSDVLDNWLTTLSREQSSLKLGDYGSRRPSTLAPFDNIVLPHDSTVRQVETVSNNKPTASPPTPKPYYSNLEVRPSKESCQDYDQESYQATRALSSHPINQLEMGKSRTPASSAALPQEEFPVQRRSPKSPIDLKHPFPRRLASHPVLLKRASSVAYPEGCKSVGDSPGPSPRSPLRSHTAQNALDCAEMSNNSLRKHTPKVAPSIKSASDYSDYEPFKAIVTTECSGPIKRPKSRGKESSRLSYAARRAREERVRQRKQRSAQSAHANIDAVMQASAKVLSPRQRLKKKAQLQMPEPKSLIVSPRRHSTSSLRSNASCKKATEISLTPVSGSPPQGSPVSPLEKPSSTPISLTGSRASRETQMTVSPIMLVAEEMPFQRAKPAPKPAKLVMRESKPYVPRPRSASIPRNAAKRRSRCMANGMQTPPRSISPDKREVKREETPPLPSPPPTRALPPTPPASGSEKSARLAIPRKAVQPLPLTEDIERLPRTPAFEVSSSEKRRLHESRQAGAVPHVSTQDAGRFTRASSTHTARHSRMSARLEALEKQNALLQAALMAVLKTNGNFNPHNITPAMNFPQPPSTATTVSTAWEDCCDKCGHHELDTNSSNGRTHTSSDSSALEMYMSTRRGDAIQSASVPQVPNL